VLQQIGAFFVDEAILRHETLLDAATVGGPFSADRTDGRPDDPFL
jgi:hypothetical protein